MIIRTFNTIRGVPLIWVLAVLARGLILLFNGQFGFQRDELDNLMNARHLNWGEVAYPPLAPWVARRQTKLFGASFLGIRLFPALALTVKNRYSLRSEKSMKHNTLYICRDPRRPCLETWPKLQWFQ